MKLAIRAFALVIVLTGAAAATVSSSAKHPVPSHQTLAGTLPAPVCIPGMPTCNKN